MGKDWDTFNEVVDPQGSFGKEKNFKKLPRNKPNGMYEFMLPIWKEALRVLKPGAFAFVMCAPRQDVLCKQIMALTDAGFDMSYSSIYWTYSSGFPKAHNISKTVDKRANGLNTQDYVVFTEEKPPVQCNDASGRWVVDYTKGVSVPAEEKKNGTGGISRGASGVKQVPCWVPVYGRKKVGEYTIKGCVDIQGGNYNSGKTAVKTLDITEPSTPEAKALDGAYGGFQPKPAVEVIIVAMKPMTEKTFASQALANGKGITWMDDCRIPYNDAPNAATNPLYRLQNGYKLPARGQPNDGGVVKFTSSNNETNVKGRFPANLLVSDNVLDDGRNHIGFTGQNRTATKLYTGDSLNHSKTEYKPGYYPGYDKNGSYSRYFDLDKWAEVNGIKEENNTFPFLICPKASKKEKNAGLEEFDDVKKPQRDEGQELINTPYKNRPGVTKNFHPTVKPLKLMSYLITLGSRKGDVVLDPFAGSGTTLVAAKKLNRRYIGIEMSKEYCEIIKARLSNDKELSGGTSC